jgi:hypothetical protein
LDRFDGQLIGGHSITCAHAHRDRFRKLAAQRYKFIALRILLESLLEIQPVQMCVPVEPTRHFNPLKIQAKAQHNLLVMTVGIFQRFGQRSGAIQKRLNAPPFIVGPKNQYIL